MPEHKISRARAEYELQKIALEEMRKQQAKIFSPREHALKQYASSIFESNFGDLTEVKVDKLEKITGVLSLPIAKISTAPITTAADLAPLIRAARKRMKMSQQDFADAAGVGRRFLSELENGKPSLEFDKVLKCALGAGIDLSAKPRRAL
jgi:y4mF family transcriptional regulator